jgi:hypothetical protein
MSFSLLATGRLRVSVTALAKMQGVCQTANGCGRRREKGGKRFAGAPCAIAQLRTTAERNSWPGRRLQASGPHIRGIDRRV